ncbi:hypothetical protein PUN28_000784 [Cardiocondyla obscurior]|uniref:Uncharacterized protein n=1 Tax=Cardiocondyla obscurior TaxID=286306 RepID=A0AAW2H1H9_9HYME
MSYTRFEQVDEKCSHIVIVLLEMHAVYEWRQLDLHSSISYLSLSSRRPPLAARRRGVRFFLRHSIRLCDTCCIEITPLKRCALRPHVHGKCSLGECILTHLSSRAQHRLNCVRTKISSNMYKIGSTLSPQAGWIYYRSVSETFLNVNP